MIGIEPVEIIAGDTVKWLKTIADYKASDGWVLAYSARGAGSIEIASTASGDSHLIVITAAQSAAFPVGNYKWIATVSRDDERYTVQEGYFTVKPNLATATTFTDDKLRLQNDIAAISAFLGKNFKYASYSINGRTLTNYGMADLFLLKDRLQRELNGVLNAESVKSGAGSNKIVRVRMSS